MLCAAGVLRTFKNNDNEIINPFYQSLKNKKLKFN
jgi:hypothetical protein